MRRFKVLLIQPSNRDCIKTLFSIYNTDEGIGFKPPIGLLYVATAIKEMTDHDVEILDCQLDDVHRGNILEFIKDSYDVIGVSAWTDFWYQSLEIAKKLKGRYPGCHITMGGPHINIFPKEALTFDCIDSIILGDGEIPMVNLLNYLSIENHENKEIPGVYFRNVEYGNYIPYVCEDLDSLPIPDRTLLPMERYYSVLSHNRFVTSMITSRGCPFRCVYCKLNFQKPVMRSAESVIKEFEIINSLGIKEVEIYDDTFNWNHRRTKDICQGIIDKKLDLDWAIRDRVDRAKEDVLIELKKAGCYRIHYGVESGSDKVLRLIKKNITTDQVREAIKHTKKYRFVILTYFMFGLPGETPEDAHKTIEFALELDTDYAEFSITIPYPGTEAYENALKQKIIPEDYWLDFTMNPIPSFEIPYVIENLISKEELIRLRDKSVKRFYFRLSYMFNEFKKIRTLTEFLQKFKMGLGLFNLLRGEYTR